MAHVYDYMNDTLADGTYQGEDQYDVGDNNRERVAAGLPIDTTTTATRRSGSIRGTRTSIRRTDFARRWVHHTVTTTDRLLRRLALAAATVGVLVLSACGSDNSDDEGDDGGGPGGER